MKKVIKCGQLFCAKDESVAKDMAIVIEDNKIVEVVPAASVDTAGAEVFDLSAKFVMPGLIDAHVHINMNGEPGGSDWMLSTSDGKLALMSVLNAQDDLMAGFTSLRDESGANFTDVAVRDMINAGKFWGPRIMCSGVSLSSTGGHGDGHYNPGVVGGNMAYIVNSPDEARAAVRRTFKYGADQVKLMATGGVMSFGDEPGAPEMSYEEMKAAIDIANERGLLSSAHAHGAEGIKNAVRAGITSIEHGMLIDEEGREMMAKYGTYLLPTIIAAYNIVEFGVANGIPQWAVDKAAYCLENHFESVSKMRKMGVNIGFGTDAATPFNFHGKQGFEFELMTRAGFSPAETLLAATKVNAKLMKWDSKVGSIEPGKFADVVAFDKNPLDDIKVMTTVSFVMKDGVVYKS